MVQVDVNNLAEQIGHPFLLHTVIEHVIAI